MNQRTNPDYLVNNDISNNAVKDTATRQKSVRGTNLRPIDAVIGVNLRRLRKKRKISQTALGRYLGVSFQQIQKYENGTNRLSVSRAVDICAMFEMSLYDFLAQLLEQEPLN
ncbi:MAG: helix-turn-helix transcriptional regulator [Alphaproteobacteria bacterium]|nr:helix-turn-helix transcriptional regulator [Alphaproteobacteria bacterium]